MANGGTITRKQLATDEALQFGVEYAKNIQKAIDANEKLKQSALEFNKISKEFKVSNNEKEFLAIKEKEIKLTKSAIQVEKEKSNALLQAQKVKNEKLRADKLALDIEAKKQRATRQSTKLTIEERVQNQALNKIKRQQVREQLGLVDAYEKLNKRRTEAQRRLANLLSAEKVNIKQVKAAQREYNILDKRIKTVDAATKNYTKNIGNYASANKGLTSTFRSLTSALGLVGGAFAFVQVMRNGIKIIRDFEKQNATLAGILQKEKEEIRELTDDARRLGETTVKTAGEVTQLQIAYARLGFNQQEIINLTESTIQGSIAMNSQLDETAQLAGAVINTFDDLSTTDAPRILDIMSLATAKSALNFSKLQTGIPIVAGAANAAGIPFTKLVALMGKLADSGIDVSTSSTALRNIFIESAAQGLNYSQIVQKIKDSQDKLTAANDEFGKRAAVSAAVLAQNIDATEELDEALQNAAGTAESMANKELDTLDGALQLLKSAWQGVILESNDAGNVSDKLKDIIQFLAENLKTIVSVVTKAVSVWIIYKGVLLATSIITKGYRLATIALAGAKALLTGNVKRSTASLRLFKAQLTSTGIGAIVVLIGSLVAAFSELKKSVSEIAKETRKSTKEFLEQEEKTNSLNTEIERLTNRYDELTKKANSNKKETKLNKEEQAELDSIIKQLGKHIPDAVTEFNKYGEALGVNTQAIKDFNKENAKNQEALKSELIKKTTQDVKNLSHQLFQLGLINDRVNNSNIELEEGNFAVRNGILKRVSAGLILVKATRDESIALRQKVALTQEELEKSKEYLLNLKGLKSERQKLLEETKQQQEEEAETLKKQEEAERKSEENRKKANAAAKKRAREKAELEKKLAQDAFELAKFRLELEIELQDELTENEKANFLDRIFALEDRTEAELKLAELKKEFLLKNENLTTDGRKLILEQYYAEVKEIDEKNKKDSNGLFAFDKNKFQKGINEQLDAITIASNNELTLLNEQLARKELTQEEHEKKVAEIKAKYAKQALEYQISQLENLLKTEELTAEQRKEFEKRVSDLKLELSEIRIQQTDKETNKTLDALLKIQDKFEEYGTIVSDLGNAIFDNRIQKIDEDIQKNEEYYARQLELAGNDEAQKQLIQVEAEKKRQALEKKKRKEQRKQAILNKAMAALDIGINTGIAIVKAVAQSPATGGLPFSAIAAAIGALQLATVLAKPIPKYAKGTENHPGGWALVGEERPEVISEPNKTPYIVSNPSVLDLPTGTQVTPSLDEYKRLMNASILASVDIENNKLNHFQAKQSFNSNDKALIKEMQLTREVLKKKKQPIHFHERKIDIDHAVWRSNNIDW